jgi:hypothetical protein
LPYPPPPSSAPPFCYFHAIYITVVGNIDRLRNKITQIFDLRII